MCPPVYLRDRDHSNHQSRCSSTEDCNNGQLCCYYGDFDNHICRLKVPAEEVGYAITVLRRRFRSKTEIRRTNARSVIAHS